jgi:crossover junction endodeoxyribonuclease RuvC
MGVRAIRIIGIDPGLRNTGWGVIEAEGSRLVFVACGSVHSDVRRPLGERLRQLHDGLGAVILRYSPGEAAISSSTGMMAGFIF